MRFVVKKEIFEELPSACFGVVMAKGIDNNNAYPVIEQFLDESIQGAVAKSSTIDDWVAASAVIDINRDEIYFSGFHPGFLPYFNKPLFFYIF